MSETIILRGPAAGAWALWLSWSLHCYGCGASDARRRGLLLAAIGVVVGFAAGLAL